MTTVNYTKQLTVLPQTPERGCGPVKAVRVVITVTSVSGLPDLGVFVYKVDSVTGKHVFRRVADPSDMSQLSYATESNGWLRKPVYDSVAQSATEAESWIATIEANIKTLCVDQTAVFNLGMPTSGSITG